MRRRALDAKRTLKMSNDNSSRIQKSSHNDDRTSEATCSVNEIKKRSRSAHKAEKSNVTSQKSNSPIPIVNEFSDQSHHSKSKPKRDKKTVDRKHLRRQCDSFLDVGNIGFSSGLNFESLLSENATAFALHQSANNMHLVNISLKNQIVSLKNQVNRLSCDNQRISRQNKMLMLENERLLTTMQNSSLLIQSTVNSIMPQRDDQHELVGIKRRKSGSSKNESDLERSTRCTIKEFDSLLNTLQTKEETRKFRDLDLYLEEEDRSSRKLKSVSQFDVIVKWLNDENSDDHSKDLDSSKDHHSRDGDDDSSKDSSTNQSSYGVNKLLKTGLLNENLVGSFKSLISSVQTSKEKSSDVLPVKEKSIPVERSISVATSLPSVRTNVKVKTSSEVSSVRGTCKNVEQLLPSEIGSEKSLNSGTEKLFQVDAEKTSKIDSKKSFTIDCEKLPQVNVEKTPKIESEKSFRIDSEKLLGIGGEKLLDVDAKKTPKIESEKSFKIGSEKLFEIDAEKSPKLGSEKSFKICSERSLRSDAEKTPTTNNKKLLEIDATSTPQNSSEKSLKISSEKLLRIGIGDDPGLPTNNEICSRSEKEVNLPLENIILGDQTIWMELDDKPQEEEKAEFLQSWLDDLKHKTRKFAESCKSSPVHEPDKKSKATEDMEHVEFIHLCNEMITRMDSLISKDSEKLGPRPSNKSHLIMNFLLNENHSLNLKYSPKKEAFSNEDNKSVTNMKDQPSKDIPRDLLISSPDSDPPLTSVLDSEDDRNGWKAFHKCLKDLEEVNVRRTNDAIRQTMVVRALRKLLAKQCDKITRNNAYASPIRTPNPPPLSLAVECPKAITSGAEEASEKNQSSRKSDSEKTTEYKSPKAGTDSNSESFKENATPEPQPGASKFYQVFSNASKSIYLNNMTLDHSTYQRNLLKGNRLITIPTVPGHLTKYTNNEAFERKLKCKRRKSPNLLKLSAALRRLQEEDKCVPIYWVYIGLMFTLLHVKVWRLFKCFEPVLKNVIFRFYK